MDADNHTRTRRLRRAPAAHAAAAVAAAVCLAAGLGGCSVGRSATGEAVIGLKAGWHPDTDAAQVAAGTVGTMLFGPAGGTAAVGLVGALGGLLGWSRQKARAERAEGRHEGWDERELASHALGAPSAGGAGAGDVRAAGGGEAGAVTA